MTITINRLIEILLQISPMYNSPDFRETIKINFSDSFTKPFKGIVEQTIREFDLKCPLFMWDREIYNCNTKIVFRDNYDQYLKGLVAERYLEFVPTSVLHYTKGLLTRYRDFTYVAPYLKMSGQGKYYISYFTKHPVRFYIDEKTDTFTDESHIYGIFEEMGDEFTYFMYLLEFNLLSYMSSQKQQMSYSELPLEIYQGLEDRKSELKEYLDDWWQNNTYYAKLYI